MYEIFENLLKEQGLTAYKVAKATGVTTATLTSWKQGKYTPKPDKLQKIADYLGIRLDYLTGQSPYRTNKDVENAISINQEKGVKIPVLENVVTGTIAEIAEDIIDWEEINPNVAKTGTFFGIKEKGDSMSPRIAEGDVLIVRKQDSADTNDVVIVTVNDKSVTCKRLIKHKQGITLVSFNPMYNPMDFTNEEIQSKHVKIIGKVVENRQKY